MRSRIQAAPCLELTDLVSGGGLCWLRLDTTTGARSGRVCPKIGCVLLLRNGAGWQKLPCMLGGGLPEMVKTHCQLALVWLLLAQRSHLRKAG